MHPLWRANLRFLLRHRWQTLLTLLGIALGVAVVTATDLVRTSAHTSFVSAARQLTGPVTHRIHGVNGRVPNTLYVRLRTELGVRRAAPVITGHVRLHNTSGPVVRLWGVDPLAEITLGRQTLSASAPDFPLLRLLSEPKTALAGSVHLRSLATGNTLEVLLSSGNTRQLHVIGHLPLQSGNLLLMDIAGAQILLGIDHLSQIDLVLSQPEQVNRIRQWLPPGFTLEPASARQQATLELSRAFELNLDALGLLALAVGVFLIFNTVTLNLQRRQLLLARLRALGLQKRELLYLLLAEALVIGLAATLLGLLLGATLAVAWHDPITTTINRFYYQTPAALQFPPWVFIKGGGLGLGAALLASWLPIRRLLSRPLATQLQRVSQEQVVQQRSAIRRLAASIFTLAAWGLLAWQDSGIYGGLLALGGLLLAAALIAPDVVRLCGSSLHTIVQTAPVQRMLGPIPQLATRESTGHLSRTGLAVMALTIAMSASSGMNLMVESFRETVALWLDQRLSADIYLSPVEWVPDQPVTLPPDLLEQLQRMPEVAALYTYGSRQLLMPDRQWVQLSYMTLPPQARQGYHFKAGDPEQAWLAFDQEQAVLISEPLAYHRDLQPGDSLHLPTPKGKQAFRIAGVFFDYGNTTGRILMTHHRYEALWEQAPITGSGLYLQTGTDTEQFLASLPQRLPARPALDIRSTRQLYRDALTVFDNTFLITQALRAIALLVAVLGLFSTLQGLLLERERELASLRALGLLPRQLTQLLLTHAGLLGLISGLYAIPIGLGLAWLLSEVVNPRSFGWSILLSLEHLPVWTTLGLSLLAALLAAVYPAWRFARRPLASSLRAH